MTPAAIAGVQLNSAVELHEVVIPVMRGDRGLEVFEPLGERIRQTAESAAMHTQRVILFLNVACGNQINHEAPATARLTLITSGGE